MAVSGECRKGENVSETVILSGTKAGGYHKDYMGAYDGNYTVVCSDGILSRIICKRISG